MKKNVLIAFLAGCSCDAQVSVTSTSATPASSVEVDAGLGGTGGFTTEVNCNTNVAGSSSLQVCLDENQK
jgi:hypothetical protein